LKQGTKATIVSLNGGRGVQSRLVSLGLLPGVEVEVCSDNTVGHMIVKVLGSRLGIGRGVASKVTVSLIE